MAHVFISYSKKNRDYARRLADHLLASGFDVWIDDRIDYGDDWWVTIVEAIRNCGAFVVVMTPESDQSRWCQREVTIADELRKPTFPILLEGDLLSSENWSIYVRTQYADVRQNKSLPDDEFLTTLEPHVPRKTQGGDDITNAPKAPPNAAPRRLNPALPLVLVVTLIALVAVGLVLINNANTRRELDQTSTHLLLYNSTVIALAAQTATHSAELAALSQTAVVTDPLEPTTTDTPEPSATLTPTDTPEPSATLTPTETPSPVIEVTLMPISDRYGFNIRQCPNTDAALIDTSYDPVQATIFGKTEIDGVYWLSLRYLGFYIDNSRRWYTGWVSWLVVQGYPEIAALPDVPAVCNGSMTEP